MSKLLCIVSSIFFQVRIQATIDKKEKQIYTDAEFQLSKGIMIKGIIIEPILPSPEHNPKPFVRIFVEKDSVVNGYKI